LRYRNGLLFALILLFSQVGIVNGKPTLKACGHHDYAPWNWLQDDKIVGVCAEVASELFGRLGYQVELTYVGPWKRCQQMIESGEVDLNICSFSNDQRKRYSVFSQTPMASNENALFMRKGDYFDYTGLDSLDDKFVGLVRGVSLGNEIDIHLQQKSHVIRAENYHRLFAMLKLKRIDAVIIGRQSGQHLLNLYGLNTDIVAATTPLVKGDLYFSMSKQSSYITSLNDIESALQSPQYRVWLASLLARYSAKHKAFIQRSKPVIDNTSNADVNRTQ
tara:strand:+ start:29242 stop:30069 length:828 start_codon:yes stop_codon:yes gene_type:complete